MSDIHIFKLPSSLDISATESFVSALRESSQHPSLQLDASDVARITTPAIQIILAAFKSADKHSKTITIATPSDSFTKAFADLGLADILRERAA